MNNTNMTSLWSIQHRDRDGRVIGLSPCYMHSVFLTAWSNSRRLYLADPDRSNPTRHRFERPLDTIRSFEAAVEDRCREDVYGR